MKKLLFTFLSITLIGSLSAQSIPKEALPVCYYKYTLQPPSGTKAYGKAFKKQKQMLQDSGYAILSSRLSKELDLSLMDINTMKGKLKYNNQGYPVASPKKAMKDAPKDYYVKIHATMTCPTKTSSMGGGGFGVEKIKTKPVLKLEVLIVGKGNKEVFSKEAKVKHDTEISTTTTSLYNFKMSGDDNMPLPFFSLLNEAIDEIVK